MMEPYELILGPATYFEPDDFTQKKIPYNNKKKNKWSKARNPNSTFIEYPIGRCDRCGHLNENDNKQEGGSPNHKNKLCYVLCSSLNRRQAYKRTTQSTLYCLFNGKWKINMLNSCIRLILNYFDLLVDNRLYSSLIQEDFYEMWSSAIPTTNRITTSLEPSSRQQLKNCHCISCYHRKHSPRNDWGRLHLYRREVFLYWTSPEYNFRSSYSSSS